MQVMTDERDRPLNAPMGSGWRGTREMNAHAAAG